MGQSKKNPPRKEPAPAHAPENSLPAISPDFVEQDFPEQIDNVVPTRGYEMTPMVGLGGSAGSIAALQEFFHLMPADSGIVFVVILHLSPSHESTLASLLGAVTKMPVKQAANGEKVLPNHVYVIPPGKHLATLDGNLKLTDLEAERGKRVAVDLFFRSLADTHGPHASAIILSGADGDGAIGIKRIKERGGLTIAQDPEEAEHSAMPRTAISTGMVDWVLKVSEMPQRLTDYYRSESSLRLPPEEGPSTAPSVKSPTEDGEAALRDVLIFLRMRTGRDFSYYKRATILRRIARRMQVNAVGDLPAYLGFLRTHPGETGALLQDLLISVTNFFRDRECFEALGEQIPALFKNKTQSDALRVWVPGCATGEEAYSMAIMLLEYARDLEAPPTLQVFACDLNEDAIAEARAGLYPDAITADVSEERLRRFFVKEAKGYRVRREVREMVLFAVHDLLKDAPFSRIDLISCRNLLIYLNREAQKRAIDTFHFALRPEGRLFLGSSETVDDTSSLFHTLDKKHRIYAQVPSVRTSLPVPAGPGPMVRLMESQDRGATLPVVHGKRFLQDAAVSFVRTQLPVIDRATLTDLHFRLLERLSPPSVIVNQEHEILHLSEHAGRFMQLAGGEPTNNILRIVHPMLRIELRAALLRAAESDGPVEIDGVPVELEGQSQRVDIRVFPAREVFPGLKLIVFHVQPDSAGSSTGLRSLAEPEPALRQLERELERMKLESRNTVEQYEASTEELKASNEELQAMNEELRSATEELETSREELQSINEELTTVNLEMKTKVEELAHANSDLQNLMASTSIAIIFLDRSLAITRYTPSAVDIFHFIPGDLGRPLSDLKSLMQYPDLIEDAENVLKNLIPIEREVREGDRWFLARLQPYRTLEDHIAGVVLILVDITERIRSAAELKEKVEEVLQFNKVAVGRENRMIDLKKEVNELAARLGETARYSLEFEEEDPEPA